MKGHKFLKITGILMIVSAAISILAGVFVGGLGALAAGLGAAARGDSAGPSRKGRGKIQDAHARTLAQRHARLPGRDGGVSEKS